MQASTATDLASPDRNDKTRATGLCAILLCCIFAITPALAAPLATTTPAPATSAGTHPNDVRLAKPAPRADAKSDSELQWSSLTPPQQQALAPLAQDWPQLDNVRRKKWISIANRFPAMKPEEQKRVQDRMRVWAALTPEQRRVARESYARTKKMDSDQKTAQWEQYQQLPEEQKRKLAADAAKKKTVTRPPAVAQGKTPTVPAIKTVPKRAIEKSVMPHAMAGHQAIPPVTPPAAIAPASRANGAGDTPPGDAPASPAAPAAPASSGTSPELPAPATVVR